MVPRDSEGTSQKNASLPGGGFLYGKIVGVLVVSFRVCFLGVVFCLKFETYHGVFRVPNFHDLIER